MRGPAHPPDVATQRDTSRQAGGQSRRADAGRNYQVARPKPDWADRAILVTCGPWASRPSSPWTPAPCPPRPARLRARRPGGHRKGPGRAARGAARQPVGAGHRADPAASCRARPRPTDPAAQFPAPACPLTGHTADSRGPACAFRRLGAFHRRTVPMWPTPPPPSRPIRPIRHRYHECRPQRHLQRRRATRPPGRGCGPERHGRLPDRPRLHSTGRPRAGQAPAWMWAAHTEGARE